MNPKFHENIESAYRILEKRLNLGKKYALAYYDALADKEKFDLTFSERDKPLRDFMEEDLVFMSDPIIHPEDRVCILLRNGYVAKVKPHGRASHTFFYIHPPSASSRERSISEEENVQVLREYGFTEENGFLVPEHKVIGVELEDGKARVNPDGGGWVIAEDLSENGIYDVTDVMPWYFIVLDNRNEFLESYESHVMKLMELYNNPEIKPSVYRHAKPKDPIKPISKMLLARIKDNVGEIVIGDLNNICFEKKSP